MSVQEWQHYSQALNIDQQSSKQILICLSLLRRRMAAHIADLSHTTGMSIRQLVKGEEEAMLQHIAGIIERYGCGYLRKEEGQEGQAKGVCESVSTSAGEGSCGEEEFTFAEERAGQGAQGTSRGIKNRIMRGYFGL